MTYLPYTITVQRSGFNCAGVHIPWFGGDTEELFRINSHRIQGPWLWRSSEIVYSINRLGYRMCEFEDLRWPRHFAVFGCSHTVGIGLRREMVWWDQLSRELDLDVVNAAEQGTGPEEVLHNLAHFLTHCEVKPRFVIIQWPDPRRRTMIDQYGNPWAVVPNLLDDIPDRRQRRWYEYQCAADLHWSRQFEHMRFTARSLCQLANVRLFEFGSDWELQQWGIPMIAHEPWTAAITTGKVNLEWANLMARDINVIGDHIWAHPGSYAQNQILALIRPWLAQQQLA